MNERKLFEKWARTEGMTLRPGILGTYAVNETEYAWQGWEARAAIGSTHNKREPSVRQPPHDEGAHSDHNEEDQRAE